MLFADLTYLQKVFFISGVMSLTLLSIMASAMIALTFVVLLTENSLSRSGWWILSLSVAFLTILGLVAIL